MDVSYRAIDRVGDTVEFWFIEQRDLPAAKRLVRKALARHGRRCLSGSVRGWLADALLA